MNRTALFASLVVASLYTPGAARAETINCTNITSLPATITTQGVYCLKQDLSTALASGNAITIATNNVSIDCNGFKIGGLAAGPGTQAIGIRAENRLNAVIRNCNVRGFSFGMFLQGGGHVVEDNRLDGNTTMGVIVMGDGSVVRGNRVFDTGGSTSPSAPFIGIYGVYNLDLIDNTVSGVMATPGSGQAAIGIYASNVYAGAIDGNRVRDLVADGAGPTFGLVTAASGTLSLRGNQIAGSGVGTGLACSSPMGVASGNHVLGFATAVDNCYDGGGNVTN